MPRHKLGAAFAAGLAALLAASVARAEILLEGVHWQAAAGVPAALRFQDVAGLRLAGGVVKSRVRARVRVRNASPVSREGILLRYSVAARLSPASAPAEAGEKTAWAVPFIVEEKRVPRIGAQQTIEASLDPTTILRLYAARVRRAGYRILGLRLQVMVEPHRGEQRDIQTLESVVKVTE
ncbi:MAG: hypothetical protein WC943_00125 [Elusimicrobiota bacterium]|jgi:hypothetical protein